MSVVISVHYNLSCPPLVGQQIHPFLSEAVLSAFRDLAQLPSVLSSPHQATLVFAVFMLSFLVNLLLSPSWSVSLLKRYCTSGGLNNSLQTLFHMICRLHSWLYRMICPFFFFFFFPIQRCYGTVNSCSARDPFLQNSYPTLFCTCTVDWFCPSSASFVDLVGVLPNLSSRPQYEH